MQQTDNVSIATSGTATQNNDAAEIAESSDESSRDDDDENDPRYLIDRYVHLKTRIWEKEHALLPTDNTRTPANRKLQQLRAKQAVIERDILFDKSEAENIWAPVEIRLQAEENSKRKTATIGLSKPGAKNGVRRKQTMAHKQLETTSGDASDVDDADADVFGAMFTTMEDQDGDQPRPLASNIRILDFGKPTGITPRQLLDQICRSVDAGFKLKVAMLEKTSYSVRHKLELFWPRPRHADTNATQAIPEEVILNLQPRRWVLEMKLVAAVSTDQSVSYAAALMLFLVSSIDGQETQISFRLTGAWRDLLISLSDTRKEVVKSRDKLALKELRQMIDKVRGDIDRESASLPLTNNKNDSKSQLPIHQRSLEPHVLSPDQARGQWSSRASGPAYQRMLVSRQQLPIYQYKAEILDTIFSHPVSIISAETGSGKSTQCGSYILERELSSGRDCRILITQPRRISAITLARRVSQEIGEAPNVLGTMGSLVGYSIRLESKTSAATRLTFATTGVLLRMLESSPMLEQLDCLILDEVHERTLETDLLFIALRELLKKRSNLKIVLMSATVDAKMFSDYFGGAPVLDIPGRTYPVEIGFLEDAVEATNDITGEDMTPSPEPEETPDDNDDRPAEHQSVEKAELSGYSNKTRKRLAKMDEYRIDYGLIVKLAKAIATKPAYAHYNSAMLIFMPGLAEIRRLHRALLGTDTFSRGWHLHLLHSSFSTEDLEGAFSKPPNGEKKIVIATNIAETGITIPDVTAVIDTCKEKVMRYNERRQLSKLTEGFISRSSAKQRRGRAARVQDGLCFHLVTRHHHDNVMQDQSTPEILRLSLQDPILRIKIWNFGSAEETLEAAITPPPRKNIARAVVKLQEAGALTGTEQLTPLGEQVARLPLDASTAKLAILGAVFRCLEPVLAIISIMTSKSPFVGGVDGRANFARADSDLLSASNAYEGWKKARSKNLSIQFCQKNFLSEQTLTQIEEQKVQLFVYLADGGQVVLSRDERAQLNKARINNYRRREMYEIPERYNKQVGDDVLLSLISMAFFPRILVREGRGWRNVYTNQQVSLANGSVNKGGSRVKWLSFSEAMHARPGNLNVSETSRIPEPALALLLGQSAEVKMFSGVISIDSGKIRLAVGNWKQALAVKRLRKALSSVLERCHRRPGETLSETDQQWLDLLMGMMAVKQVDIT